MGLALGVPTGNAESRSAFWPAAASSPLRPDVPACIQARGHRGRNREAGHAAHAAPRLRHTPAAGRLRHPHRTRVARPCRREHDDDLYTCVEGRRHGGAKSARCDASNEDGIPFCRPAYAQPGCRSGVRPGTSDFSGSEHRRAGSARSRHSRVMLLPRPGQPSSSILVQ